MALLFVCINIGIDLLSSHLRHEPMMHETVCFINILIPFANGSSIHQATISIYAFYVTVVRPTFFIVIYMPFMVP
jgi:hypothetical protein